MITVELRGRLGNQMFQYVICRSIAESLGCKFSISPQWLGKNIFKCPLGYSPYKKSKNIFKEGLNMYNDNIKHIKPNTHLHGYWQSEKYFLSNQEDIRQWFHLSKPDSPYIKKDYCLIHFRAQDAYNNKKYLLPLSYFEKAKEYMLERIPNIKFIIITDNIELSKKYFKKDKIIKNDVTMGLQLLLHSKNKIISNSSFSWWPAWLGLPDSNIVIAPNRWLNYNFNKDKKDIFYPKDIITKKFIYL